MGAAAEGGMADVVMGLVAAAALILLAGVPGRLAATTGVPDGSLLDRYEEHLWQA